MKEIGRNKIFSYINFSCNGLRQDNPFSNTFGVTSLAIIEELEPETIAKMSIEVLVEFLQEKGKNRFEKPEEMPKYLQN